MDKKLFYKAGAAVLCALTLSLSVFAAYPSSGETAPEDSVLLEGSIIGEAAGWDGSQNTGRKAAFDGDPYTYYDPSVARDDNCYTGVKLKEKHILTKVCILPRDSQPNRFYGAMIQGSNDGVKWFTLWQSDRGADTWEWQVVTDFDNNIGYLYYRYWNNMEHGDVAEVELYGYPGTTGDDPYVGKPTSLGEVSVRFDAMGGEADAFIPMSASFGKEYPTIEYQPKREGYVFDGWYTSPTGGVKIETGTRVTSPYSHILYAHWLTEQEYKNTHPEEAVTDDSISDSGLTPVQGLSVIMSAVFILGAVIYISSKRINNEN